MVRTNGGLQTLQPRLDTTQPGWRVDKLDVDDGDGHWCLYVDGDSEVVLEPVGDTISRVEGEMMEYVEQVANLGVIETMLDVGIDR